MSRQPVAKGNGRHPDHCDGIPGQHIARVVNTQIHPGEADEERKKDGETPHADSKRGMREPGGQQCGHAAEDAGSEDRVAAGKTWRAWKWVIEKCDRTHSLERKL